MAPGLGIAVRFVHGMIEGLQLDGQIAKLRPTADQNVLDLVPASFRDCARLRLLAAQCRTAGPETQSDAGAELVRAFNGLRKEAMEEMMEAASGETATRADMLRLVQSMDELARATRSDVAVVADASRLHSDRLAEMEARIERLSRTVTHMDELARATRSDVAVVAEASRLHSNRLAEMEARIEGLSQTVTHVDELARATRSDVAVVADASRLHSDRLAEMEARIERLSRTVKHMIIALGILAILALLK